MNKTVQYRRWLHQNAELSFEEYKTQLYICDILSSLNIEHQRVAGTGVLAKIGNNDANTIVLRADIDALPITESSGVDFCSLNEGVMHACGHDMHAAALLGALEELAKNPPKDRTILGLFQPGEELYPGGATKVLAEGVFDGYDVKAVIGQHCSPELPVGVVGLRQGQFMASTDEIHITVKGQGGHAAQPALLKNPVWAAVELLTALHKIEPGGDIAHVLAFGRIVADGATNVIPDEVYIEGTFRTFSEQWRSQCKSLVRRCAAEVAHSHSLEIEVTIKDGYPSVYNNEELCKQAHALLSSANSGIDLIEIPQRLTAEDFGYYGQKYPALFLRLGVGSDTEEHPTRLHTSGFAPDERALEFGVALLVTLSAHLEWNRE